MREENRRIILLAQTDKGGWTKKQLAEWGISWPPPRGWKRQLEKGPPLEPVPDRDYALPLFDRRRDMSHH